jgi:hypothetical protein
MTPLDSAFAAMQAGKDDADANDTARLRYYQCLADSELFVLLGEEATGAAISPALFEVEQGRFALTFDRQDRLSEFTGQVAPYAAMSGRVLVRMLAGQGIGLGINLEVAPSSNLIPASAVDWLNATLAQAPDRVEARIAGFSAPGDVDGGLPEGLIDALQAKLAPAAGLAQAVYLAAVSYGEDGQGHMLGFVGVPAPAQDALAKAAGEALTFFGEGAGAMDVGFFASDDPVVARLAAAGQKLKLPRPTARQTPTRPAPGSNPDKPPILK